MMQRITSLAMAAIFTVAVATTALAASSVTCTVDKVEGDTVLLNCGDKAGKLTVGSTVKVKAKKKTAIEGC